jgi:uncharacterized membrane protein
MTEAARDRPALLDLVLRPHRSLSPAGFWAIMAGVAGFSFVAGIVFWSMGAWPVAGFLGADVVLVYIAFKASYAGGRAYEHVRLSPESLTVERMSAAGRHEAFTLQPHWLRVELSKDPSRPDSLRLSSHGRSLAIGAFLSPDERAELAQVLDAALGRLRQPALTELQPEDVAHSVAPGGPAAGP